MKEIFVAKGYDKRIRPANMTEKLYIDVNLYFDGILHLSEVDQKMTSVGYFYISWNDPGLMWPSSSYGDIEKIYVPQNDIWKPDIVLQNGFKTFKEMGESFNFVEVYDDGEVGWVPSQVFESRCSMDITFFPFDKQTCVLDFEIWSFKASEVRIKSTDGIAQGDYFQEHSSWKVLSLRSEIDNENFYESRVSFKIEIQRKPHVLRHQYTTSGHSAQLFDCCCFCNPRRVGRENQLFHHGTIGNVCVSFHRQHHIAQKLG